MPEHDATDFYRETFDALPAGCQVITPDWIYLYVNEAVCKQSRKSAEELIGRTLTEAFPGIEKTGTFTALRRCFETGQAERLDNVFDYDDGSSAWFNLSITPVPEGLLVISHDITVHKQNEDRVNRLNRLYAILSNVNQAIVRHLDLGELFEKVCRIAVDNGNFPLAWIGFVEESGRKVIPVASSAAGDEFLVKMDEWADQCTACTALEAVLQGERLVCNRLNPATEGIRCATLARGLGFRSHAMFPLKLGSRIRGFIALHSKEKDAFDNEELRLLDELALDLSFSMEFVEQENRRVEAELELRKSEDLFSKAFYLCPDAVNVNRLDDGMFVSASWGFTRMSGYSEQELIGRRASECNLWSSDGWLDQFTDRLKESGIAEKVEAELLTKSGETRVVSVSSSVIDISRVPHVITVMRDITERKRTEQALFAEREKLAVTLRSIGDAVIATDLDGRITIINTVAEQMCGYPSDEAIGLPLWDVFHIVNEFTRKAIPNPVQRVLETDSIIELANHTILIRRDGSELVIADSAAPIKDRDGATIGVVLVFRDQTEKQRMQDHLNRSQRLDSLGVLAGGIAHDFNNLLGGIFGYLQLAEMESRDDRKIAGRLAAATGLITRARDLTSQLLTFSKGGKPVRKAASLKPLLQRSAGFALSGSNVSCQFQIPDALPACFVDDNQIGQVIDNMVLNAQQAMPMGGVITISAEESAAPAGLPPTAEPGTAYIKISIADTGIGIPGEILPRIFDPFFTTKQQGNGLGLATCYSIIRNHDGVIDVQSTPGNGTTFRIFLPVAKAPAQPQPASPGALHQGAGNILIMDDQEFILDVAKEMLGQMGYTVFAARDAAAARKMYDDSKTQGGRFEAIFLDLTIPGGPGGRELIGDLRSADVDIPVFALSGYSEDPVISKPQEFGFTDSLRKPFKLTELSDLLNRHLTRGA